MPVTVGGAVASLRHALLPDRRVKVSPSEEEKQALKCSVHEL